MYIVTLFTNAGSDSANTMPYTLVADGGSIESAGVRASCRNELYSIGSDPGPAETVGGKTGQNNHGLSRSHLDSGVNKSIFFALPLLSGMPFA